MESVKIENSKQIRPQRFLTRRDILKGTYDPFVFVIVSRLGPDYLKIIKSFTGYSTMDIMDRLNNVTKFICDDRFMEGIRKAYLHHCVNNKDREITKVIWH